MHRIITTPLVLMPIIGQQAQAVEPKVVVLSCDGTVTDTTMTKIPETSPPQQQEQIQKAGVVVNLDERTVSFLDYVAHINDVDAAFIVFGERKPDEHFDIGFRGEIDRVTGYFEATTTTSKKGSPIDTLWQTRYEMLCKATNRVF
jgi:hypothetical protein